LIHRSVVLTALGGHRIDRGPVVAFDPCLVRSARPGGGELIRLGHPLLDAYLDLVTARARPNTLLATAFDLKAFFSVVDKDPSDVVTSDVLAFIKAQREPRLGDRVVRIEDGQGGLSARTIKRRLASTRGAGTAPWATRAPWTTSSSIAPPSTISKPHEAPRPHQPGVHETGSTSAWASWRCAACTGRWVLSLRKLGHDHPPGPLPLHPAGHLPEPPGAQPSDPHADHADHADHAHADHADADHADADDERVTVVAR